MDSRGEQVTSFKYLGAFMTEKGTCVEVVKARIAMSIVASNKKKHLLTVEMYGCETWSMKKEVVDKLNAFEMWVWRRRMKKY
jgi:hypothetical protein